MLFARLRGRIVQQPSLDTIVKVLDLVGSLLLFIAAILTFFVPAPVPPPMSGDQRREPAGEGEGEGGNLIGNCEAGNQDEATPGL